MTNCHSMTKGGKFDEFADPETPGKHVLFVQLPVTPKCPDHCSPAPGKRRRHRKCCDVAVYVRALWTGLSFVVTASCCLAFVQPYWLTNVQRRSSFGLYSYCVQDNYVEAGSDRYPEERTNRTGDVASDVAGDGVRYVIHYRENCNPYGQYFRLAHLPSNAWQIACVLYGGGCFLQAFGAVASLVTSLMVDWWASRFAGYTGYIQTMGVMTCVGGLLTFPLGLDSNFVRHYCAGAGMFYAGDCAIGWSFSLGIMATALSIFCPFLSQYVTFRNDDNFDV